MRETVRDGQPSILVDDGSVHRLEKEVLELERCESFGWRVGLREHELELISLREYERCVGFRTDAHPIEASWRRLRAVRFHGDLEAGSVERTDCRVVQLQQWFT